jgi:hypothetical protein
MWDIIKMIFIIFMLLFVILFVIFFRCASILNKRIDEEERKQKKK